MKRAILRLFLVVVSSFVLLSPAETNAQLEVCIFSHARCSGTCNYLGAEWSRIWYNCYDEFGSWLLLLESCGCHWVWLFSVAGRKRPQGVGAAGKGMTRAT